MSNVKHSNRPPKFDPRMLKAFLHARVVNYRFQNHISRAKAKSAYLGKLKKETGLRGDILREAYDGSLKAAPSRTKIWCALNRDPAEYGVRLLPNGGQQTTQNAGELA